jgi:hypothetical protein
LIRVQGLHTVETSCVLFMCGCRVKGFRVLGDVRFDVKVKILKIEYVYRSYSKYVWEFDF